MKKFEGMLICTDLDGTLLKNDKSISAENINAIEHFKAEGGFFTFVTGRMPFFVSDILKKIKPNAPFGCINGGGLYDYYKKEYIWTAALADGFNDLIECIDERFPDVGIQVNTFNKTYFCKDNVTMKRFRTVTGLPNMVCGYREIEETVAKVIFGCEEETEMEAVMDALNSHSLAERFDFIRSEKNLYEILPKGTGKGTAIVKLCEYLNLDINKTVALGDYNNDISMFNAAKAGIAVSNACPDALKAADFVTVSNEENAISKVICDLEQGLYI